MTTEGIDQLRKRTKRFALDVIKVTEDLPRTRVADVMARQLVRSVDIRHSTLAIR